MKKYLLLFISIIFLMSGIRAQMEIKTINMSEAGTLTDSLTNEDKQNITILKLTGPIDARDFKCMRDEVVKLAVLDLKAASIQEYTGTDGTVPKEYTYKVNKIPDFAFCDINLKGKITLTTITFPENLIETGYSSFYSCTGLTGQLELPSKLEVIGDHSFSDCTHITGELRIPSSVISIEQSAFMGCAGITGKLIIPSGIKVINDWTFFYCTGISSVEIPRGVNAIGLNVFYNCTGLKEFISYPEVPPTLGDNAFGSVDLSICVLHVPVGTLNVYRNASQWQDFINIIDDLERKVVDVKTVNMTTPGTLSGLLTSDEKQNITNLTLIGLIDARDFKCMRDEIVNLADLDLKAATIQEYAGTDGTSEGEITYKANQIPLDAFSLYDGPSKISLTTITFPDNLIEIGESAFNKCTGLTGPLVLPSALEMIYTGAFSDCTGITGELNFPSSLTAIDDRVFSGCTGFTGVLKLPAKLYNIGIGAFQGCTGFTGKLEIPSKVTEINESAFIYCSGLTGVKIPKGVVSINSRAFSGCTSLQEVDIFAVAPPKLGDDVFKDVNKTTCVLHVPVGDANYYHNAPQWKDFVNSIDDLALTVQDVKTVTMTEPGTLSGMLTTEEKLNINVLTLIGPVDARDFKCMRDEIEQLAVLDLKAALIQEYTGPDGTVSEYTTYKGNQIPEFAFCIKVTKVGKESLTTITFPDNLREIGFASFYSCQGLAGLLVLPSTMEVIGDNSFVSCDKLTGELYIPESVTSIGQAAFAGCLNFTGKLKIPSGITLVDDWTFFSCTGLSSVEIPKEVNSLGMQAFGYCKALKEFNSYPEVPPALGDNVFKGVGVTTCVLHVPSGSLNAYKGALQWMDFVNIQEDLIPTDIDQNNVKDVRIVSKNNQIFVTSEKAINHIEVFDLQGRMMIEKKENGKTFELPFDKYGNYIVRVHLQDGSVSTNKISVD